MVSHCWQCLEYNMKIIEHYKGYDLIHEEYDDSDGFIKNIYAVYHGDKYIREVRKEDGMSYTYGGIATVSVDFKRTVDMIISKKRALI